MQALTYEHRYRSSSDHCHTTGMHQMGACTGIQLPRRCRGSLRNCGRTLEFTRPTRTWEREQSHANSRHFIYRELPLTIFRMSRPLGCLRIAPSFAVARSVACTMNAVRSLAGKPHAPVRLHLNQRNFRSMRTRATFKMWVKGDPENNVLGDCPFCHRVLLTMELKVSPAVS